MSIISEPGFYDALFQHTGDLCAGMREAAASAGVPFTTNHLGSMFGGFFTEEASVTQYHQVINSNVSAFNQFFHLMLDSGVYLAPASFEAGFMSAAHTDEDIAATVEAARAAFAAL
jgi:glutamate-1-semialdehyde 2,1-aminomutase